MTGMEPFVIAAALASAAGDVVEGVNAYQTGAYQKKKADADAAQTRADASAQAQITLEEGARTLGTGAVIAAKGGGINGSALDVLNDVARQNMYEARKATTEGVAEGNSLEAQGRQAKRQGTITAISKGVEAGATLLAAGMVAKAPKGVPGPAPGSGYAPGKIGFTGNMPTGSY